MRSFVITLLVLLAGCASREAPSAYSISSEFPAEQADVIRSAIGAWCDAVGWCPEEALFSEEAHFQLVDRIDDDLIARCPFESCVVSGTNKGDGSVIIARNRAEPEDMSVLWRVVAHEIGHFCTEHTDIGLMAAIQYPGAPLDIDETARRAWFDGCD